MKLYLRCLIFMISLLIFSLIFYIEYKIGKKKGLKKALYRITYRSLSVILAFLIAPYLNEYILNYDLYGAGLAIHYEGMNFYRIIDFIEEIIVHNEVLNDIYNMFPSLKNILMDFPQILFIPVTYVLTFFLISILLLPAYLYLSYKRKRRVLYDKPFNKKAAVWAGVLSMVQIVFVISIVLTPVNGLARMYSESKTKLIDNEENVCENSKYLEKYKFFCDIVEGYNSTAFYYVGKNPVNEYIYSSLTKIKYDKEETSMNREIVSVVRAGIVLNKTGLLDAINGEVDFDDVTKLNFKELTEEDIDIVVEAFEQSLYTKDVIYEVYEWSKAYLDWVIRDLVDKDFSSHYEYEDIVAELKIILRAINYILNNNDFLENIYDMYKIIYDFALLRPDEQERTGVKFFYDVAYTINVDHLKNFYMILVDSKIYNDFVPQIIDHLFSRINVTSFLRLRPDEMHRTVLYAFECIKIIQNHKYIYSLLHMFNDFTIEEVHYAAMVVEYLQSSESMRNFSRDIMEYGISQINMKIDIPYDVVYKIEDWDRELEMSQLVVKIVYKYLKYNEVDYDMILNGIKEYHDTVLFKEALDFLKSHLGDLFEMWINGKDIKYVVGEYIDE